MKTPEEIKIGLGRCIQGDCASGSDECPYFSITKCAPVLKADALEYINVLEARTSLNPLRDAIYGDAVAHGLWDKYKYYPATDCVDFIRNEVIELEYAAMNWRNGYEENSELYPEFCHELPT